MSNESTRGASTAFLTPTSGIAPNGLPYLNWDQAAVQINRDGDSWNTTLGTPTTVTYAFRASGTPPADAGVAGFAQFNAAQIVATEEALRLWAEAANITFVRVGSGTSGPGAYSNNATMLFANFVNGPAAFSAFAFLPAPTATGAGFDEGDVWVNGSRNYDADPLAFPLGWHILAHEIGHTFGLLHPGVYNGGANGGATYATDADHWQDTLQFTNMSYFSETNTGAYFGGSYSITPMMHDIAAAQRLFGANMTTRTGSTTYGFNSNAGHAAFSITSSAQIAIFCIWDAGGDDTLDLSGFFTHSEIDLREESFSSAGTDSAGQPLIGNISIARGAVIENAIGGAGADLIIGNDVANHLVGGGGADTLEAAAGADLLDGGAGADIMRGGAGDDTFVVDDSGDVAAEASGDGVDLVEASVTFGIGAGVENLILTGATAITGFGNVFNNTITGNAAANALYGFDGNDALDGGAGGDAMFGGNGDDSYVVDNSGDVTSEASAAGGTDTVFSSVARNLTANIENLTLTGLAAIIGSGNALNNVITGNSAVNTLYGFDGADRLDGGVGADVLFGANGDDVYVVDDVSDITVEGSPTGGIDTVESSVSRNLNVNLENLILTGAAQFGYGNVLSNVMTGNASANGLYGFDGNDHLDGGAGADQMFGANGDDTYIVDNAGDVTSEVSPGGGVDTVESSVTRNLTAYLENLTLTGGSSITGAGNALDNVIIGNAGANTLYGLDGADTLDGGLGADTLQGGPGADAYVFSAALGAGNIDTISNFSAVDDTIRLDNGAFAGLVAGTLDASAFHIGAVAGDGDDRVIYDSATGALWFDADGDGAGAAIQFAAMAAGLALTHTDFIVFGP